MAKELVDLFREKQGIEISYRYAREIIAQCPLSIRGRYVKFSDAWTWWVLNPGFMPFSKKGEKSTNIGTLSHAQANADN